MIFGFVHWKQKILTLSFELEQTQVQVNHSVALAIYIELLQVDIALVRLAIGDISHAHHIVFFASNKDLTGSTVHILHIKLFAEVLGTGSEDFHDLFRDDVSCCFGRRGGVAAPGCRFGDTVASLCVQRRLVGAGTQLDKHWRLFLLATRAIPLWVVWNQDDLIVADVLDALLILALLVGFRPI